MPRPSNLRTSLFLTQAQRVMTYPRPHSRLPPHRGTSSTINGDDRWPDVLARRLNGRWVVVNAGIGGNQIVGPKEYSPQKPFPGGPAALQRIERDVLTLSGVKAVIWLEGINDFSRNGNAEADDVIAGMREGVARIRAAIPGVHVIGATLTSALGSTNAAH